MRAAWEAPRGILEIATSLGFTLVWGCGGPATADIPPELPPAMATGPNRAELPVFIIGKIGIPDWDISDFVIYQTPEFSWLSGHPYLQNNVYAIPSPEGSAHPGPYSDELSRGLRAWGLASSRALLYQRGGPSLSVVVVPGSSAARGKSLDADYSPIIYRNTRIDVTVELSRFGMPVFDVDPRPVSAQICGYPNQGLCPGYDGISHAVLTRNLSSLPGLYHLVTRLRDASQGGWDISTDYEIY